jgi:hypothetical protein
LRNFVKPQTATSRNTGEAAACDLAFPERRGWFCEYYAEMSTWSEVPAAFKDWTEREDREGHQRTRALALPFTARDIETETTLSNGVTTSLFEHPAAELSVDDSAPLGEDRRQPDHIA